MSSRVAAYSFTYSPFTLALTGIKSRKVHGVSSIFEVDIPPNGNINGAVPVEPRTIGSGHRIVFQFNGTVTIPGTLSVTDALLSSIGNATAAAVGTEVIVTLTNIPDNRRAFVSLANVNGAGVDASAALGFLVGDITGTGRVNAADIAAVKARIGVAVNTINFRADVNACTQSIQQT